MFNQDLEGMLSSFYHCDSHTLVGGVGLYIKIFLTANCRDDMTNYMDEFETNGLKSTIIRIKIWYCWYI